MPPLPASTSSRVRAPALYHMYAVFTPAQTTRDMVNTQHDTSMEMKRGIKKWT